MAWLYLTAGIGGWQADSRAVVTAINSIELELLTPHWFSNIGLLRVNATREQLGEYYTESGCQPVNPKK